MKLEAREYYRSTYTDKESIDLYGLNPYPRFDNRFISTRYAPDIARKIGSLVPNPPMYLDLKIPLDLRMLPVNEDEERLFIINVKSRKQLVRSPDFTEKCKVLEVIHDYKRKETIVRSVSFNPI